MKQIQINLRHLQSATDNPRVFISEENIDIGITQDPCVRGSIIRGFQGNHYNLYYNQNYSNGKRRTCILAKKHLKAFLCPNISTGDLKVIKLKTANGEGFFVPSIYMDRDRQAPPEEVQHLTSVINFSEANRLMGYDANARHTLWGSAETNDRNESIFDYQ